MTFNRKRSWKNILINPRFQGKITFFIFFTGFLCALLNACLYYSYVVDSYEFIFKFTSLPRDVIDGRYRDLFNLGIWLGVVTLLILLMISLWVLFLTHQVAGAIYNAKRVIEEIRAGNTSKRIRLREKDEFQDFADSFNRMMDKLEADKLLKSSV